MRERISLRIDLEVLNSVDLIITTGIMLLAERRSKRGKKGKRK